MRFIKRLLAVLVIIITIPVAAVTALFLALTAGLAGLVVLLGVSAVNKDKLNKSLEECLERLKKEGDV